MHVSLSPPQVGVEENVTNIEEDSTLPRGNRSQLEDAESANIRDQLESSRRVENGGPPTVPSCVAGTENSFGNDSSATPPPPGYAEVPVESRGQEAWLVAFGTHYSPPRAIPDDNVNTVIGAEEQVRVGREEQGASLRQFVVATGLRKARKWIHLALYFFDADMEKLGKGYETLVRRWTEVEVAAPESNGFTRKQKEEQPPELDKWFKKRFDLRFTDANFPAIDKKFAEEFPTKVCAWWRSLQPASRLATPGNDLPTASQVPMGEWRALDKWGIRGWFVLLACVKWYGLSIEKLEGDRNVARNAWNALVEDMLAVLNFVVDARG
ncbi:SERTA domain-containing protein 3 [Marasmius tenuissimus]|uniref:SERTA domain-containing protein 3 n=1 Tax=Marasmius tenuissimus TaxID=585030 RepID=A0ABR2ZQF8_9AGAR